MELKKDHLNFAIGPVMISEEILAWAPNPFRISVPPIFPT